MIKTIYDRVANTTAICKLARFRISLSLSLSLLRTNAAAGEFALGREPESLVDLSGELLAEILLEPSQFSVGRESFDVQVGGEENRVTRSLVNSATFHSCRQGRGEGEGEGDGEGDGE